MSTLNKHWKIKDTSKMYKFPKGFHPTTEIKKGGNKNSFQKGHKLNICEKSPNWKGDKVGYQGVHQWVRKQNGKAINYKCVDCGKQALHWTNIDHSYKRNLEDYFPRCVSCHQKYDNKQKLKCQL